ncbi:RNase adapter RapZ (plasmid) [Streptomyces sp. NBC_01298]|uniref:RapZ C-terminal domain-containing protein n=1 Tax=Streptomyces sp. NBC_01298 TaxID=2903817 RepID=UPI002E13A906|nr:RNase adapter RapZ [Streptomyces sp. NBC_01298]
MPRIVTIISFGYMHASAVPESDLALDVRRLVPAVEDPALDGLTGLDCLVQQRVLASPEARSLAVQTAVGTHMLMDDTDLAQLTIAIGSFGGCRRAVVIARHIATRLAELNIGGAYALVVEHRDLGRPS